LTRPKIFVYAGVMYSVSELTALARAYLAWADIAESTLSVHCCGNDRTLPRLLAGCGCTARIAERASTWFDNHWPSDLDWPAAVRPSHNRELTPRRRVPAQASEPNPS
jgi:hypothetical protein